MAYNIDISEKILSLKDSEDAASIILDAFVEAKKHDGAVITLPKTKIHIYPDRAYEKHYFISNNDEGLKRIAFPVIGCKNLTVDGNGAELIFHGKVVPFVIDNSENITVKNLSIDYDRPFFTQGLILEADMKHVVLKIDKEEFPYKVEDGNITFLAENWSRTGFENFLELDIETKGPAYSIGDDWTHGKKVVCTEVEDGVVRFEMDFAKQHKVGNMMAISHVLRHVPGIFINESSEVKVENVTVYHAPAMALIAQLSHNITLDGYKVMLRDGTRRYISATADATHFVNCTGLVKIENCIFEHQKDDPVNVHGINTVISRICDENTVEVQYMHYEQNGIKLYKKGDVISILKRDTMLSYFRATVTDVFYVNQNYVRITLDKPVPSDCLHDALENPDVMPELEIRNCRAGYNRARGFLITTNRRVVVENNVIYSPGAGILIEGDANFWFESGNVTDVTIRNNIFDNCAITSWGEAAIYINPSVAEDAVCSEKFHKNITIDSNKFISYDLAIVGGHSVDGLKFINNTVIKSDKYPPYRKVEKCVDLKRSENITVENNVCEGFDEAFLF